MEFGMVRCQAKLEAIQWHQHYISINFLLDRHEHVLVPTFLMCKMIQHINPRTGCKCTIQHATIKDMIAYGH